MSKSLYIAEKPSVAQQFADALKYGDVAEMAISSQMRRSSPGAWDIW